jgi:hypothetical protein
MGRTSLKEYHIYNNEAGMLGFLEKVLLANGFQVYKEVSTPNGYCDIVATYNTPEKQIRWGIDGKMVCSDAVIGQAYHNRKYFDYVSICTPKDPNWIYEDFLKRNGIGQITLSQTACYTEEALRGELHVWGKDFNQILPNIHIPYYDALDFNLMPVINPTPRHNEIVLHELQKLEQAGKSAGERLTQYKMTVIKIQEYLKGKDWVSMKDILKDLQPDLYWSNPRAGLHNVWGWEEGKFETKRDGRDTLVKNKE